jgi:hypothetical protein
MHIYVRFITGKTITLDVKGKDNLWMIKCMITEKEGVPYHQQRLVLKGQVLDDGHKQLHEVGIGNKSTLELVICSDVVVEEC